MLKYLIQKEFLQIRRNAFLPRLIIIFPIMMMCVMPWVMNQEVKNIRVDVVDNDRSTLSRQLVQSIEASNYLHKLGCARPLKQAPWHSLAQTFIFNGQKPTYNAALKDMEKMDADVVLVIPQHYSRDLMQKRNPQVLIAANAVNGTKGSMGRFISLADGQGACQPLGTSHAVGGINAVPLQQES